MHPHYQDNEEDMHIAHIYCMYNLKQNQTTGLFMLTSLDILNILNIGKRATYILNDVPSPDNLLLSPFFGFTIFKSIDYDVLVLVDRAE